MRFIAIALIAVVSCGAPSQAAGTPPAAAAMVVPRPGEVAIEVRGLI